MPPMTDSKPAPSTPVAEPAVDIPLMEEVETSVDNSTVVPHASEAHEPMDDPAAPSAEDVRKAITEAYSATTKWLREQHRAEFVAHQKSLLAERGIDWSPSPTKEERAKAAALKVLQDAGLSPSDLA